MHNYSEQQNHNYSEQKNHNYSEQKSHNYSEQKYNYSEQTTENVREITSARDSPAIVTIQFEEDSKKPWRVGCDFHLTPLRITKVNETGLFYQKRYVRVG
eukprot:UN04894